MHLAGKNHCFCFVAVAHIMEVFRFHLRNQSFCSFEFSQADIKTMLRHNDTVLAWAHNILNDIDNVNCCTPFFSFQRSICVCFQFCNLLITDLVLLCRLDELSHAFAANDTSEDCIQDARTSVTSRRCRNSARSAAATVAGVTGCEQTRDRSCHVAINSDR